MPNTPNETSSDSQEQKHYSESEITTELQSLIRGNLDVEGITSALNEKLKGLNMSSSLVQDRVLNSHRKLMQLYRESDNRKKKQLNAVRLIVASQLEVELNKAQKSKLAELDKVIEKYFDSKTPSI